MISLEKSKDLKNNNNKECSKTDPNLKNRLLLAKRVEEAYVIYNELRKEWRKTRRELDLYDLWDRFVKIKNCNCPEAPPAGNNMEIEGVGVMINKLKTQLDVPFECSICENLETLTEALQNLKKSSYEGKVAYIVTPGFSGQKPPHHMAAVLAEKKGEEVKIMISDSVGGENFRAKNDPKYEDTIRDCKKEWDTSWLHNWVKWSTRIYYAINEAHLPHATIYVVKPQRQRDGHRCRSFAMHDIYQFFKIDNIFEDIELKGKLEKEKYDENVRYVNNPPPGFMLPTQSMKQLKQYMSENETATTWDCSSLKAALEKSVRRTSSGKLINMKIDDVFFKFLAYLIRKLKSNDERIFMLMYNRLYIGCSDNVLKI